MSGGGGSWVVGCVAKAVEAGVPVGGVEVLSLDPRGVADIDVAVITALDPVAPELDGLGVVKEEEALVDMLDAHDLLLLGAAADLDQTVALDLLAVPRQRLVVAVSYEVELPVPRPAQLVARVHVVHVHLFHPAHHPQHSAHAN